MDAEVFLNKASSCIQTVTDVGLLLRYRATYARVLDANRKFVDAAMRYYDLSNTTFAEVSCFLFLFVLHHASFIPFLLYFFLPLFLLSFILISLYPSILHRLSLIPFTPGESRGFAGAPRQGSHLCRAGQGWAAKVQGPRTALQGDPPFRWVPLFTFHFFHFFISSFFRSVIF